MSQINALKSNTAFWSLNFFYINLYTVCERQTFVFTFVLDRCDGGMITVCTIDLSVRDIVHCLECVDRLSGDHSATVIHPGTHIGKYNKNTTRIDLDITWYKQTLPLVPC